MLCSAAKCFTLSIKQNNFLMGKCELVPLTTPFHSDPVDTPRPKLFSIQVCFTVIQNPPPSMILLLLTIFFLLVLLQLNSCFYNDNQRTCWSLTTSSQKTINDNTNLHPFRDYLYRFFFFTFDIIISRRRSLAHVAFTLTTNQP